MHLWRYVITRFPANIERSSLKTSMHLYCDVTSLCKFGALKNYLFLVLSRVPLRYVKHLLRFREDPYLYLTKWHIEITLTSICSCIHLSVSHTSLVLHSGVKAATYMFLKHSSNTGMNLLNKNSVYNKVISSLGESYIKICNKIYFHLCIHVVKATFLGRQGSKAPHRDHLVCHPSVRQAFLCPHTSSQGKGWIVLHCYNPCLIRKEFPGLTYTISSPLRPTNQRGRLHCDVYFDIMNDLNLYAIYLPNLNRLRGRMVKTLDFCSWGREFKPRLWQHFFLSVIWRNYFLIVHYYVLSIAININT